jgi:hypothetical protein
MDAMFSSETSFLTKTTQRYIPQGGIFHNHRRENIKSYVISVLSILAK